MTSEHATAQVFLAHIGGQHATWLAEALAHRGMLLTYSTGVCRSIDPDKPDDMRRRGVRALRIGPDLLKRKWLLGAAALLPQRFIPRAMRMYWNHAVWWTFGGGSADIRKLAKADLVIAFENSALPLFRRAQRLAPTAARVLECPSVHHSAQDYGPLTFLGRRFVAHINAKKDAEISLADHIVVLSRFARDTFVAAGVPAEKLHVIPMGVDTRFFTPCEMPSREGPLRFLFVGTTGYSKGIDTLVRAFKKLPEGRASLRIAGVRTSLLDRLIADVPGISATGPLPHSRLRDEYRASHVLVLPSRFDGFALVVTEAMAMGRPVIVSANVGAADLVATSGPAACGWIVPAGDDLELAGAMTAAITGRDKLAMMGAAARRVAETVSWDAYADIVTSLHEALVRKRSTP